MAEDVISFLKETLNKLIPFMVRQGSPEFIEGLTTNGINPLPFVLSLSKEACTTGTSVGRRRTYSEIP